MWALRDVGARVIGEDTDKRLILGIVYRESRILHVSRPIARLTITLPSLRTTRTNATAGYEKQEGKERKLLLSYTFSLTLCDLLSF